ncbi:MAG: pilus assembly protein [Aquamicrobium sp.]|uniref:pilus assembly protein TadG-related protein n=1 Tax=Aquamicrobium sp. TaxID=1872579 RepID=UPI00349E9074|nr:pilus assembly protein [Aquamicrobium sp.]
MAAKPAFSEAARRFGRDRRGNFGMMMAVLAPVLLLGAGFGINVAQMSNARSNLLAALDSAVTSTARDLTTGVIKEQDARASLEAFLFANGVRGFSRLDRLTLDSVVLDKHRKTVEAQASVVVDIAFPLFGAAAVQTITTESAARYSDRRIEVAMMLDVTGSMAKKGKTDKIGDLKDAAKSAVEALLEGNRHSPDRVRVALVPYAEAVNVGKELAGTVVFQEAGNGPVPPPNWARPSKLKDHCATERKLQDGKADFSDAGPDELREHFTKGKNGKTTAYQYKALVNRDERLGSCPSASLLPLTSDKSKLDTAIDGFKASGYTAGGIAAQWGYYMLSPKWRSTVSGAGLGAGPADVDPEKIAKIAILMTDGEFNTAFPEVTDEKDTNKQTTRSPNNARSVCAAMKKDGIEIFTIGFALPSGESAAARKVLADCASPDTPLTKHFYDAATGEELKTAFKDIVRNIERLALIR